VDRAWPEIGPEDISGEWIQIQRRILELYIQNPIRCRYISEVLNNKSHHIKNQDALILDNTTIRLEIVNQAL
jgi:hypothetical protein